MKMKCRRKILLIRTEPNIFTKKGNYILNCNFKKKYHEDFDKRSDQCGIDDLKLWGKN
jgi:hypothetical protein